MSVIAKKAIAEVDISPPCESFRQRAFGDPATSERSNKLYFVGRLYFGEGQVQDFPGTSERPALLLGASPTRRQTNPPALTRRNATNNARWL
jgi:hypothetical protein